MSSKHKLAYSFTELPQNVVSRHDYGLWNNLLDANQE